MHTMRETTTQYNSTVRNILIVSDNYCLTKGQLISKRLLEKIVWTKIATKKFDNFCPGGQFKKIKALSYTNYGGT